MLEKILQIIRHWARRSIKHKYFPDIWYAAENWLLAADKSHNRLLELGCGRGIFTRALLKSNWKISTVDPSAESIAVTKERIKEEQGEIEFFQEEPERLPFDSDTFDAVACFHMLEFSINPEQVLAEIHRTLKPGGKAIVVVFKSHSFWSLPQVASLLRKDNTSRPFKCFSTNELKRLIKNSPIHLDSIKFRANYLPLYPGKTLIKWPFYGSIVAKLEKKH